jgi:ATP/maltotriose-dependent transcriptional regulator MalT/DNA-binding SARP family transcriptional activator
VALPAQSSPQPVDLLDRGRLRRRLAAALRRRLTLVVADAGWGKSVLLAGWASTVVSAWYTVGPDDSSLAVFALGLAQVLEPLAPSVTDDVRMVVHASLGPDGDELDRAGPLATLLCEALEHEPSHDVALVLDDVHELGRSGPSVRLLEELCRQAPPGLHLVLGSRVEPPFAVERLRGRGDVLDLDASELAFEEQEVATLLTRVVGDDAFVLAGEVYALTLGWPAAVRLVVESLRSATPDERAQVLQRLGRPGERLFSYVAEEVVARAPSGVRLLLRRVAPFERFDLELCRTLGIRTAAESLVSLRRSGLFVEDRGEEGWFALHALVREFVRDRWPLGAREEASLHARAADHFRARGRAEDALTSLLAAGDLDGAARLLESGGPSLLASGRVESVLRAAARLTAGHRSPAVERLAGEAHEIRGEWDEALECFERAAGRRHRLDAGLAWRLGLIHHLRGHLDQALEAYERGEPTGRATADDALLLAWKASAYWLRGDANACREAAAEAFACATEAGDAGGLAAAHTVLAMMAALDGDRLANDAHYVRALEYARRAGDVLQTARVRTNRGSRHLEEGEYEQALTELEHATRLADLTGFAFFRALSLANRGEVRLRLGRLEEAIADLESSKALYQRTGSRMVSYPLTLLGDVYRERGDSAMARGFYEEALRSAEQSGDVQGLVPALCGLAALLATEEPARARELAARALEFGEGMGYVGAHVAAGWAAVAAGDRGTAARHADDAAAGARLRRDRAGLAQSLELAALSSTDPHQQAAKLAEAIALWQGIGSPLGEARAELLLGAAVGDVAAVERAEHRLQAAGARVDRGVLAALPSAARAAPGKELRIVTLGGFGVERRGRPVGATEWQSRKARDLLKILVARRGKPTPRDALMEALWPGQSAAPLSNRLSVALSTLRAILDPERTHPSDRFIVALGEAVALRTEEVDVDVERFLADAGRALELHAAGASRVRRELEAAETAYVGDFLEEELYEDWAAPLREEARSVYLAVAAALAELAEDAGEGDAAVRYRMRMLERDPFDERAHLGVVRTLTATGRHGEARRAYRRYAARMDEIGVEPTPFPAAPITESPL